MKKLISLLVLFIVASFLLAETQVSISSSASLATIGDRINLKILAKTSDPIDSIKVSSNQKLFDIVDEKDLKKIKEKDYTVFEKNISIAFFSTGDFEIESFKVEFLKGEEVVATLTTNSIPITVKSVLSDEDKDIKSIKEPIELTGDPLFILKFVFLFLALVGLGLFIYYWIKKRKGKTEIQEPTLPPVNEFEAAMAKLLALGLFEKSRYKEFFLQLTVITKRLINRKYLFNAEDFTTYETMYHLKSKEDDSQVLDHMFYVFKLADLVKFARVIPEQSALNDMLAKITDMVVILKKREEVVENPDDTLRA